MTIKAPLIVAGPTASGKSALALELAKKLRGGIVCADSRQFYRGMVVGTAGPSEAERAEVPHFLFHEFDPASPLDAARFLQHADRAVADCQAQGLLPILVGGTGLYLRAWRYGIDDAPPSDPKVRAALEARLEREGIHALYTELEKLDPAVRGRIHPNDPVRTIRALEIHQLTQSLPTRLLPGDFAKRDVRRTGHHVLIWPSLEWLRPRLESRAKNMFNEKLIKEVESLNERLPSDNRLLKTMGYEEMRDHSAGLLTEEQAIARMVKRQWAYARRQRTWFKKETWWRVYPADSPQLADSVRHDWEGTALGPP